MYLKFNLGNWNRMRLKCSKRNKLLWCFVVILLTITLGDAGRMSKGQRPIKKSRTGDVNRKTDQEGIKTTMTDVGESTAANVAEALSQGAIIARDLKEIKIVREQVAKAPTRVSHHQNQEPRPFAHNFDIPSVFSAVKPDEGEPKAGTSSQAEEETISADELAAFIDKQEAIKHKKIDSLAEAINDYDSGMVLVSHTLCSISQVAQEIWVCKNHTVTDDSASKSKKHTRRRQNNG